MIGGGRGLIVHTGHYGAVSYHQGPAYGAQKAGADKMAADMARELRPHHVAAVSIWMGGLDTERVRAHTDALPPETRDVRRESPEFTGRVIAALYRSPELMTLSGRTLIDATGRTSGRHRFRRQRARSPTAISWALRHHQDVS